MSPALPAAACADVRCLADVFSQVPDPRGAKGRRQSMGALLSLAVVALLCGEKSAQGISRFARLHPAILPALGFAPPHQGRVAARRGVIAPPSNDTVARVLALADAADMNALVGRWLGRLLAERETAAVDGKALRGQGGHVVSVYCASLGHVLWQDEVDGKENEMSALLRALPGLLARLGKVRLFTADAGFCHKAVARALVDARRDYLMQLKAPHRTDVALARDSFAQLTARPALARTEEKRGARAAASS